MDIHLIESLILTLMLFILVNKINKEIGVRRINIFFVITILLLASCATFLKKDDVSDLKELERISYILKENIGETSRQGKSLKKGDKIKLYITTGDNFIKVYGYPANISFVKAERFLLLYLFEEDFKDNIFDKDFFREKLNNIVEPAK